MQPSQNERATNVMFVHGVGPYRDRQTVEQDVEDQLRRQNIRVSKVTSFDWYTLVGDQFDQVPTASRAMFQLLRLRADNASSETGKPQRVFRALSYVLFQVVLMYVPIALFHSVSHHMAVSLRVALKSGRLLSAIRLGLLQIPHDALRSRPFQMWIFVTVASLVFVFVSEWSVIGKFAVRRVLRRFALVLLWPAVWATVVPKYSRFPSVLVSAAMGISVFALGLALFGIGDSIFHTGDASETFFGLLVTTIVMALLLLAAGAIILISRPFLAAFKRIADVLLWLGNPPYRKKLRLGLASALRDLGADDQDLLLIGHSLGTVLLIDVLIAEVVRGKCFGHNRIRLLTFGSPLKSMISKIFPEIFPKPSVVFDAMVDAHPDFCWINVYRPLDYIGRELDLKAGPQAEDISTEQHTLRGLASHADYWADDAVWNAVGSSLSRMERRVSFKNIHNEHITLRWVSDGASSVVRSKRFRDAVGLLVKVAVFSALPILACVGKLAYPRLHYRGLISEGTHAAVTVKCKGHFGSQPGHYPASYCFADLHRISKDQLQTVKVKNGVALDDIPSDRVSLAGSEILEDIHELPAASWVRGDQVRVVYEPEDTSDIVVESGTAVAVEDPDNPLDGKEGGRRFRVSGAFPEISLLNILMNLVLGTIFVAFVMGKLLLSVVVAIESFLGIDSGPDHYGLAD